jgi:hypothetical protein
MSFWFLVIGALIAAFLGAGASYILGIVLPGGRNPRILLGVLIFIIVLAISYALFTQLSSPQPSEFVGQIMAADTGNPIRGAIVSMDFDQNISTPNLITDSNGKYKFKITLVDSKASGRLVVKADNYESYDTYFELTSDNLELDFISLNPINAGASTPSSISDTQSKEKLINSVTLTDTATSVPEIANTPTLLPSQTPKGKPFSAKETTPLSNSLTVSNSLGATSTPTLLPTDTPIPPTATSSPTDRPLPTPTPSLQLDRPVDNATVLGEAMTPFNWFWNGPSLSENQGFEVRIWQGTEQHFGAYDARHQEDIVRQPGGRFQLSFVAQSAYSVNLHGTGEYFWTVAVVQLEPYDFISCHRKKDRGYLQSLDSFVDTTALP